METHDRNNAEDGQDGKSNASSASASSPRSALLDRLRPQLTAACHMTEPADSREEDGNVCVHVIDDVGAFSCSPIDLSYLVLHSQAPDVKSTSEYSIVAIMGCQSTGKSTLLNLLFGCRFSEMDASSGRSQTTKGVWLDSGHKRRSLVVMDLEGTDSGERGEDRTTFERQTALYAMAVAELLIINMWEHDIGRYTASNYGILKTVIEVNLQLFHAAAASNTSKTTSSSARTVLLFVIRDHIEEDTPLVQLSTKLENEVTKIWGEIRKPPSLTNAALNDLFILKFVALPHMKLQRAAFNEGVGALRDRFINPATQAEGGYLFDSKDHGRKSVPADGFGVYMQQCWQTIIENKELNLPTQKEMLATFRCDEISNQLYRDTFQPTLQTLQQDATTKLVSEEFASTIPNMLRALLRIFDRDTRHYHQDIVRKKRVEFLRKLAQELEELVENQMKNFVGEEMMNVAKKELKSRLARGADDKKAKNEASKVASSDGPHPEFGIAAQAAREKAMQVVEAQLDRFEIRMADDDDDEDANEAADAAEPLSEASFSSSSSSSSTNPLQSAWSALRSQLASDLESRLQSLLQLERTTELKKLSSYLERKFKAALSAPLTATLKRAHTDKMWPEIGTLYRSISKSVIDGYVLGELCKSYECSEEEREMIRADSERQLHQLIRLIFEQHTALLSLHMRTKFDKRFRYDSAGRMRVWKPSDNIRAVFKRARDSTLKMLDLFAIFRLDEYKEETSKANKKAAAAATSKDATKGSSNSSTSSTMDEDEDDVTSSSAASTGDGEEDEEEDKLGQTTIDYSSVDPVNIVLDPTQRLEKESTFRFDIEGALREAELAQVQNADRTKIPLWLIGLLCFFAMDEILAILRNPLLLILLVLVGGGAYMAHQVGMLGPIIRSARSAINHLMTEAQSAFAPPAQARPHRVSAPTHSRRSVADDDDEDDGDEGVNDGEQQQRPLTQRRGSKRTVRRD